MRAGGEASASPCQMTKKVVESFAKMDERACEADAVEGGRGLIGCRHSIRRIAPHCVSLAVTWSTPGLCVRIIISILEMVSRMANFRRNSTSSVTACFEN